MGPLRLEGKKSDVEAAIDFEISATTRFLYYEYTTLVVRINFFGTRSIQKNWKNTVTMRSLFPLESIAFTTILTFIHIKTSQSFILPSNNVKVLQSSTSLTSPQTTVRSSYCTSIRQQQRLLPLAPCFLSSSSILEESYDEECDVLVLGSGPAARAIATLLSSSGGGSNSSNNKPPLDVILSDSNYDKAWPPNYGTWVDEWESIQQLYESFGRTLSKDNIDTQWDVTDCYFGGSFDIPMEQRMRIDRPYLRLDKFELQSNLSPPSEIEEEKKSGWYRVLRANHISEATSVNLFSPSQSLRHDETGSTIALQPKDSGGNGDGDLLNVRAKLIVDCTGHETKLVVKEGRPASPPPGFQIAYGVLTKVNESNVSDKTHVGPYAKDAMTLFDYRTDHFDDNPEWKQKAIADPTFMYAMPIQDNEIFFEETSLVARPAVSFQECKDRCFQRLKYLGIEVEDILEEEFCYIPMGGPLPAKDQRIIAFGGSAAMVHPSTGFNIARNMMGAGAVAKAVQEGLGSDKEGVNLDQIAASAYNAIWSPANIRQRNFAVFGGDFLMDQNVEGLRGFFDGFFKIPLEYWGGFLAGWPGLPNNDKHETWSSRLIFGLVFVSKLQWQITLKLVTAIITYSIKDGPPLIQSVTPLLGEPESFEYIPRPKNQGDVAAKREAWKMIQESKVEDVMPNSFAEFKVGNQETTKVEKEKEEIL